eukprot:gene50917-50329_t
MGGAEGRTLVEGAWGYGTCGRGAAGAGSAASSASVTVTYIPRDPSAAVSTPYHFASPPETLASLVQTFKRAHDLTIIDSAAYYGREIDVDDRAFTAAGFARTATLYIYPSDSLPHARCLQACCTTCGCPLARALRASVSDTNNGIQALVEATGAAAQTVDVRAALATSGGDVAAARSKLRARRLADGVDVVVARANRIDAVHNQLLAEFPACTASFIHAAMEKTADLSLLRPHLTDSARLIEQLLREIPDSTASIICRVLLTTTDMTQLRPRVLEAMSSVRDAACASASAAACALTKLGVTSGNIG